VKIAQPAFSLILIATGAAQIRSTPTFSKDVAPILYRHCTNCHRPGEIDSREIIARTNAAVAGG
jgi:hypothetical protein